METEEDKSAESFMRQFAKYIGGDAATLEKKCTGLEKRRDNFAKIQKKNQGDVQDHGIEIRQAIETLCQRLNELLSDLDLKQDQILETKKAPRKKVPMDKDAAGSAVVNFAKRMKKGKLDIGITVYVDFHGLETSAKIESFAKDKKELRLQLPLDVSDDNGRYRFIDVPEDKVRKSPISRAPIANKQQQPAVAKGKEERGR